MDSGYATEKLLLEDNKGIVLYQGTASGTVKAGEKKLLETIHLPGQTVRGPALLQVQLRDTRTGELSQLYKPVEIGGMAAALNARTDKSLYLPSEPVTATSSISNGNSAIENGILDITVTAMKSTETGDFSVFLPKAGGASLDRPHGVAAGPDGSVYAADTFNHRVLKFDADGDLVADWGGYGDGSSQFKYLQSLAVGNDGNVYVADTSNHRVQKFDSNGNFITQWGSYGSGNGQFRFTNAVAVGPDGFVYVTDKDNYRVQKFDGNGNLIAAWGGYGGGDGQFIWPWGIAVAPDNYVYVVDRNYPRIQKFDNNGHYVTKWGSFGGGNGQFNFPHGIAVDNEGSVFVLDNGNNRIQKFYRDGTFVRQMGSYGSGSGQFNGVTSMGIMPDAFIYVTDTSNSRIQKMAIEEGMATLFETTKTVNQAPLTNVDDITAIGALKAEGKLYLRAKLKNSLGQAIAESGYPFFIFSGNAALIVETDRKIYRPGETVTITGEVKNISTSGTASITFDLKEKISPRTEKTLYSEVISLASGESHPFSVNAVAGVEGTFALTGAVTQNAATLAQIADQYEVASPKVTASLTAPDIAGNDPFAISLELKNSGKVEATISINRSFDSQPETVTIPAGQTKLLQYSQQISVDTTDTFIISGDLIQALTKTVKYGPAVALSAVPQALYPEGKISLPLTVTNSGLIDSQFSVNYQLSQGTNSINQQSKSYFLAKGGSSSDSLIYDLSEGSYQLAATGQKPAASAMTSFQVRKETKAELTQSAGAQSASLLPITVNVTNLGYLPIEGSVRVSLVAASGSTSWSAVQEAILPQTLNPEPRTLTFAINLASLKPGAYTIKGELLDAGNRQIVSQSAPFNLLGPTIAISQLPQSRTIPSGNSSDFIFKVKNSGNQEGSYDLSFKADDLINSTRSEWLKPGEEKEIAFALQTASDLEEKDYFATYNLKAGTVNIEQGTVKYHLQGLNLALTATLDKASYVSGDTATLTLNVTQQDAGAAPSLFARVNYNGYNEKQSFTLSGSQTLVFNVPLTQITGEKLFYGIYTESGRSIHLNTIYVHKADAALALATEKQVYNPGEIVVATISGSASGDLTLTGPGDFTTTFAYGGSATRSFILPETMTAGTYTIKAQLKTPESGLLTASHPFDVAGIQVKVKEALLDKTRYSATDSMKLTLNIESNRDLAATIRTWIVDPAGEYTPAGEGAVSLTASAPLLLTIPSSLLTEFLGIHKLVYGIYQGDLLLASGAKAFDIGEAVLLSLATDRGDYPEVTLPVTVKADLYGTTAAGIELLLDGQSINSDSVTLSGTGLYTYAIPAAAVTPGLHTLKATLSAGGLTSSRETRFTSGSSLPDLTARVTANSAVGSSMTILVTVNNQGKTAATASSAALYDGDPAAGGQMLAILSVPPIPAGSSVTLPYVWNLLGKSGDHLLFVVADYDNSVAEFIEGNNRGMTDVSLPSLTLAVAAGKSSYGANEAAAITVDIANLTANLPLENGILKIRLTSASGGVIDLPERSVGRVAPATVTPLSELWNSGISAPSTYTVTARLVTGTTELASATTTFTTVPTISLSGSIAPAVAVIPQESSLEAIYTVSNSGNVALDGKLQGIIRDPQSGVSKAIQEIPLHLPVSGSKSGTFRFPLAGLDIKGYDLILGFTSAAADISVAQGQFTIRDTIPPLLTVSTLSDGSYTNQETLNVAGTVSDNSGSAQVEINGAIVPLAADGTFSHPLLLNNSDNPVEVIAIDMAGNRVVDSRTIHFDKTAPTLTITSPADNSKTAISPIEVKGSVDETSTVTVKVKENVQIAVMNGKEFSATVIPEPRWNTIEITAIDLAGNPSSQKRSVLFDDRAPSLAITEPDQDIRTNKSSITISGTASDPYTAAGVTVNLDGTIMTPPVIGGIFSQIVTFTEEKLYPITVTASNEVGTQVSAQRNVIYDRTPPNLTIDPVVTPTNAPGQVVTGTREDGTDVSVTCATATAGAMEYPAPASWRVSVTGLQQGENRIQATATDPANNRTTANATILYVPKAPEVTISATPNRIWPPNGKLVPVVIAGNVATFGSEIKEATVSVADEYGKYTLQGLKFGDTVLLEAWREGSDMDGRLYTITATVTDRAGNRTTRATTVTVPHDMGK